MTENQGSGAKAKKKIVIPVLIAALVALIAALWAVYPLLNIPVSVKEDRACEYFDESHRYLAGEHFYFGRHKADENGGIDALEWRVLRVKSDRLVLISDRIIECKEFNDSKNEATWETSSLRGWLNGEFYNNTFSAEEKSMILDANITNPDNEFFGIDGGNDTVDKVYCLSNDEAEKYFSSKIERVDGVSVHADRIAVPHQYVYDKPQKGPMIKDYWWLRTPGKTYGTSASYVDNGGFICDVGDNSTNILGVRPVIEIAR